MLIVDNLSFDYGSHPILTALSFGIQKGTYTAIIGESGSGKSTLLELIYGLLQPSKGTIHWNETLLLGPEHHLVPGAPFMKYLSQDFDLMPYTTVSENIGAFLSNFFPKKKQRRIQELLEVIELTSFAQIKVKNLSGGQKQRVALARALAKKPELLLLDEPFGHIDNFRKNSLRRNIFRYLKAHQITCIVATHDVTDVLSYTDRTIVLHNQKIMANGPTPELYQNPKHPYVAALFGETNVLPLSFFSPKKEVVNSPKVLLYSHELQTVAQSNCPVIVRASYLKDNHYLVEASKEDYRIFFNHPTALKSQSKVYLDAHIALLEKRILDLE